MHLEAAGDNEQAAGQIVAKSVNELAILFVAVTASWFLWGRGHGFRNGVAAGQLTRPPQQDELESRVRLGASSALATFALA
jgi:hypothetical protein